MTRTTALVLKILACDIYQPRSVPQGSQVASELSRPAGYGRDFNVYIHTYIALRDMHLGMLVTFPCSSLWLTLLVHTHSCLVCIMRAMHLCIVACIAICILDHAICISLYVGDISQLVLMPLVRTQPCFVSSMRLCTSKDMHFALRYASPCTARYASLVMSGDISRKACG
jgi:hypothetical protein